jgi:hypothetical protein
MANTMNITFDGNHIRAESKGDKSLAWSRQLFSAIVGACEANNCFRVLGISESTKPVSIIEGFEHIELFRELGINTKYRIAWVELNPAAVKTVKFVDAALFNRMLPGRLFPTEEEARAWLFGERGY